MSTTPHPPQDALLQFAAGDTDPATGAHVEGCPPCRERLGALRTFLHTVRDDLLEARPGCLSPDDLARLPPGAEYDDPHLRQCPLCRHEVRMLMDVESAGRLGTDVDGELPAALFYRPSPVVAGGTFAYQRGAGPVEWVIAEGEEKELTVEGSTVRLRCAGGELVAEVVAGGPAVALALSNDLLEKRVPLAPGEQRIAAAGFKRVRLELG